MALPFLRRRPRVEDILRRQEDDRPALPAHTEDDPDRVPGEALRAWLTPIGRVDHDVTELRTAAGTHIRVYVMAGGVADVFPGEWASLALMNPPAVTADGRPPRFTIRQVVRVVPNPKVRLGYGFQMKLRRVQTSIAASRRGGNMPSPQEERILNSMVMLWDAVRRGGQMPIDIWWFFILAAPSTEDLEAASEELRRKWRDRGNLVLLDREQLQGFLEGWLGAAPSTFEGRAGRLTRPGRGMLATPTAAASLWPGAVGGSLSDGRGQYMGNRAEDGRFFQLNLGAGAGALNKNMVAAGASGEGKSTLLQSMIEGALIEGMVGTTFDVDGEYLPHAANVGAKVVDMTLGSGNYFDPLALPARLEPAGADAATARQIQDWNESRLRRIFSKIGAMTEAMAGSREVDPGLINTAIRAAFAILDEAGIDRNDPQAWDRVPGRSWPGVMDWYAALEREAEADPGGMAARLAGPNGLLWRFFRGDMAGLFGRRLDEGDMLGTDWTVFHVASLADSNDDQTAGAVKTLLLGDALMNQLIRVRLEQRRYAMVQWDECQRQMSSPHMARHIGTWATTIRKWNGCAVVATNVPQVLWETQYGSWLWENTSLKALFWLEHSGFKAIREHGDVPVEVIDRLGGCKGTNVFSLRHKGSWDFLRLNLPPREIALYETRR